MRSGLPLAALLATLAVSVAACSGGDDDDDGGSAGRVEISLLVPPTGVPAQDPFDGIAAYHVEVLDSAGNVVVFDDFVAGEAVEMTGLDPGLGRVVVLEGRNAGGVALSRGRTLPFDILENQTVERTLYFSRIGELSTVYGAPAARTGAATWTFSDGTVLIAGGLVGGTAVNTSEIFDFDTDSVVSGGTMASGAQAFAAVASLGNDTILLAGGVDGTAGDPVDVANVYTLGTGWASGVPAMSGGARREMGAGELGAGRVLIAGGAASNDTLDNAPALSSTLLFEWSGTTGTWSAGPVMEEPRMGPMMLEASGDVVVVVGGANNNISGGNDDFSDDSDTYTWNGASLVRNPDGGTQVGDSRGWARVVPVATDTWIVFGGEEGNDSSHSLRDQAEEWTWTGTAINSTGKPGLPDNARGGGSGRLAGGQLLLVGGNDGEYPADSGMDFATLYDVATGNTIALPSLPNVSLGGTAAPLPDGTSLVVIDGAVLRYNPL